jgi:hypothetical protein
VAGPKGDPGAQGPAGPQGARGEKGEPGPGTALRVVQGNAASASCDRSEIVVGAMCSAAANVIATENGAQCGDDPNSTTVKVRLVCAKK